MGASQTLPIPFGWYGVAFSDELQAGEVKPLHYFGREMVMFRTESGQARILDAYCPHLGAHIGHGGRVNGESVACPFHGWEFSGDGMVQNIPYAKRTPPRAAQGPCIYSYPVVEKNRVIWAWYHPENIEPLFDVVEHEEVGHPDWTEFKTYEWVFNAHIQETAENGCDGAHFIYVHGNAELPRGEVVHDGYQRHAHYTNKAPDIDEDGNFDRTGTKWREAYLQTSNNGPGQTWQRFTGVFETFMLGIVTPINENRVHLRFAYTQPKSQNEAQQIMSNAVVEEVSRQVEQDMPIWENKIYRPNPILCDGDGPIGQFRRWFSQFYAENRKAA